MIKPPIEAMLPPRLPAFPKEPTQISQFLQQLSNAIATQPIDEAAGDYSCEDIRENTSENNREAELQLFVCWALEQSRSGKLMQDESLQLLDLAWQVQKRLWADHSSWLLR